MFKLQELHRFLAKNEASKAMETDANKAEDKWKKLDFKHIPIEQQVVVLFPGQGAQHIGMGKRVS